MQEVEVRSWPGIPTLVVNIAVALLTVWWFIDSARAGAGLEVAGAIWYSSSCLSCLPGITWSNPTRPPC